MKKKFGTYLQKRYGVAALCLVLVMLLSACAGSTGGDARSDSSGSAPGASNSPGASQSAATSQPSESSAAQSTPAQPQGTPLSEEELAQWEEKLNTPEWYGFVTQLYTQVKYVDLYSILYTGKGIDHEMDAAELENYQEKAPRSSYGDSVFAVKRDALDSYLREHTGLGLEEFAFPFYDHNDDGFYYDEAYDSYYFSSHEPDPYAEELAEVLSGTRDGDTVRLTVQLNAWSAELETPHYDEQHIRKTSGVYWPACVLTITNGMVVSYTNEIYTATEPYILEDLQRAKDDEEVVLPLMGARVYDANTSESFSSEKGDFYMWYTYFDLIPSDPTANATCYHEYRVTNRLLMQREPDGTMTRLGSYHTINHSAQ